MNLKSKGYYRNWESEFWKTAWYLSEPCLYFPLICRSHTSYLPFRFF